MEYKETSLLTFHLVVVTVNVVQALDWKSDTETQTQDNTNTSQEE
jgi:hypothetical protein